MSARSSTTPSLHQLVDTVAALAEDLAALRLRVQVLESREDPFSIVEEPPVETPDPATIAEPAHRQIGGR